MEWYEPEVQALERRLKEAPAPKRAAVFYGSSSIRMWSDLASDLGDSRALNLGFGGSTLAACVYFFNRLVSPAHPASLTVYAGDNDLGDGRSPKDVLDSFRALAALIIEKLPTIPFGFISIKLSPARLALRKEITETNSLVREKIQGQPNGYFINVFDAMLDDEGQPRRELFSEDGLHLSRAGYRLWAELLAPYRNRIFTPLLPAIVADGVAFDR